MKKHIAGDPEEGELFDLPLENELLMLKLKAEFGAECNTGNQDIPPDVVNEFLRSVYDFEIKFREPCRQISVYDRIGRPAFKRGNELGEKAVSAELKKMIALLNRNSIQLDVLGEYPDRVLYTFLTEELLVTEMDDIDLPGYTHHYCYEDFHPNHELDIRREALCFIEQWFSRKLGEYSMALGQEFIHPDTRIVTRAGVIKKIQHVFAAYTAFADQEFILKDLHYKWDPSNETGTGEAAGWVKYRALTEAGEVICFEGSFSFYFSNENNWWSMYYFVFPGFCWDD